MKKDNHKALRRLRRVLRDDHLYQKTPHGRGKACGHYLITDPNNSEEVVSKLRCALSGGRETAWILRDHGINIEFHSSREGREFREGVLSAIKDYVIKRIHSMEYPEARAYIRFFGGGSYEGLLLAKSPDGM